MHSSGYTYDYYINIYLSKLIINNSEVGDPFFIMAPKSHNLEQH